MTNEQKLVQSMIARGLVSFGKRDVGPYMSPFHVQRRAYARLYRDRKRGCPPRPKIKTHIPVTQKEDKTLYHRLHMRIWRARKQSKN